MSSKRADMNGPRAGGSGTAEAGEEVSCGLDSATDPEGAFAELQAATHRLNQQTQVRGIGAAQGGNEILCSSDTAKDPGKLDGRQTKGLLFRQGFAQNMQLSMSTRTQLLWLRKMVNSRGGHIRSKNKKIDRKIACSVDHSTLRENRAGRNCVLWW